MLRTVVTAGLMLACGAALLTWLKMQQAIGAVRPELHLGLVAAVFLITGCWAGWRMATRRHGPAFRRNEAAVRSLGLTGQEMRVLQALSSGDANKEIARALGLSPNTVKTHLAHLFAKLGASTRTQAVTRARELALIP
jgi:two-component system, NarL family, response regulator LiaR